MNTVYTWGIQIQEHYRIKGTGIHASSSSTMSMTYTVPFPCAVFKRDKSSSPYVFSHYTNVSTNKKFPTSLKVNDLQTYSPGENWYIPYIFFYLYHTDAWLFQYVTGPICKKQFFWCW